MPIDIQRMFIFLPLLIHYQMLYAIHARTIPGIQHTYF